jgi:hypothetical protein
VSVNAATATILPIFLPKVSTNFFEAGWMKKPTVTTIIENNIVMKSVTISI